MTHAKHTCRYFMYIHICACIYMCVYKYEKQNHISECKFLNSDSFTARKYMLTLHPCNIKTEKWIEMAVDTNSFKNFIIYFLK